MANDIAVIDRFLDIFSRYIDSGFGLISGDVGFLVKILIGIDVVLAALAWAAGEDEVIQAFAKKVLYVGFFAFILNNWNSLAQAIFKSFAALGLKATGSSLSYADFYVQASSLKPACKVLMCCSHKSSACPASPKCSGI
jgi:type IV secretion system protein TrbL